MKYKVGDRARIVGSKDVRPEVAHLAGKQCSIVEDISDSYHVPGTTHSVYIVEVDGGGRLRIAEYSLRPILPDSDTYHPADISIDDLMNKLREVEHV